MTPAAYEAPAATTYSTQGSAATSSTTEPQPSLAPNESVPAEPQLQQTQKPETPAPASQPPAQPGPGDGSATNFQAPELFKYNQNDLSVQRRMAPVWTAVYHRLSGAKTVAQPVSWQQAERDAEGWTSVSE